MMMEYRRNKDAFSPELGEVHRSQNGKQITVLASEATGSSSVPFSLRELKKNMWAHKFISPSYL